MAARARARCLLSWPGECGPPCVHRVCDHGPGHVCARPPGHPAPCACACGAKPAPVVDDGQAAELALELPTSYVHPSAFVATAQAMSGRLDRFCAELEAAGFEVKRDGWTATIGAPPAGRQ